MFYDLLLLGFDIFIPLITSKISTHPSWYNHALLKIKNRKRKAYLQYKRFKTAIAYTRFCNLRKLLLSKLKIAYKLHLKKI